MNKLFVVSLGGSLINPGEVDVKFLKGFRSLILKQVKKGNRFILITGGGKLCREYQEALKSIISPTNLDLDWLGIYSTRFNAQLIRLMFGKIAHAEIPLLPGEKVNFKEKILVSGGEKPGRSSDGPTVQWAKNYGSTTAINLSNIDYVYTKDPRKFKDAKKLKTSLGRILGKLSAINGIQAKTFPLTQQQQNSQKA